MFIAAFIFVISIATLIQFAISSWRARLLSVASTPLQLDSDAMVELSRKLLAANTLQDVLAYQKCCPDLSGGSAPNMRLVRLYYRFLQFMKSSGGRLAQFAWADREMTLCTRYAAVALLQRLALNQSLATEFRAY
jgi:hypothetical protein